MFLVVDNCEDGIRNHFLTSEYFKTYCTYCTMKTLKEAYSKDIHKYIVDITSNKDSSLFKKYEKLGLSSHKNLLFYKGEQNYIFIDYIKLFEKVEFLPEGLKVKAYETQDYIKDFLTKTIEKTNKTNQRSAKSVDSKALTETGVQLNNIIPHNKPLILVDKYSNIPENQNHSDYISMDELKILSSVHIEVLKKLSTEGE